MKKLIYVAVLAAALAALVAPPAWAADDDNKFNFHGEIRQRADYQNNFNDFADSGDPTDTGDQALAWPYRVRLAMEANFTKNVSAWIEIQNVGVWGGTNNRGIPGFFRTGGTEPFPFSGVTTGSSMELYQANFTLDELWSDNFSLTFGRQELTLGTELILGDNDFYAGFTHDGLTGSWDFERVDVTVWYFRTNEGSYPGYFPGADFVGAVPPAANSFFISPVAGGLDFYGGYGTWTFKNEDELDVYLMYQDYRLCSTCGIGTGTFDYNATYGARYGRELRGDSGFDWNIEYAQQSGKAELAGGAPFDKGEKLKGSVIEAAFGYNFHTKNDNDHKVYGKYTSFTGDDPATADWEGFLFVAGDIHDQLGKGDWFLIDTLSPISISQGISAWSIGYNGFYKERHEFGVAYWDYSVEEKNTLAVDDIGTAIDLWYGFTYSRNVNFEFAYSMLDPGDFLLNGGAVVPAGTPSDSANRVYAQARLRF